MARHQGIGGSRVPRAAGGILLAALFAAAPARGASTTILLTEVEADPVPIGSDTPGEWFELMNITGQTITLTNWTITDDQSSDVLPQIVLAAGECIVAVTDSNTFRLDHPGYSGRLVQVGSIGAGLSIAGDRILLRDASGTEVDCVSWGTNVTCTNPAPAAPAANTVATLQRASMFDTDLASDWTINQSETPCPGVVAVADGFPGGPSFAILPNPCFGRATIACSGVASGSLVVTIHDAAGRRVRAFRDAGAGPTRSFAWDGRDEQGRAVPTGIYLVRLGIRTGAPASGRLLLLR
ncbi:MAG: lamin tail domain-containing protein [Candidatus Eisenbacteria bacterium]